VGTTSLRGVDEGEVETTNDFGASLTTASALARGWYDYDKCTGTHAHTHTLHDTRPSEEILVKADDAADQVGCRDPYEWVIDSSYYLNTALEAAQLDAAAVSGDATGHPGVVSSLGLGTHPDAVSEWIWPQAPVTPRSLGDGLTWSRDHEIYQAPSPIFDCSDGPIKRGPSNKDGRATPSAQSASGARYNDGLINAQPSGIGGVFTEDSVMYYEYESGILRFPGARGLSTAALTVETKASNAKSPLCGTDYIQRTIDSVLETTMGIESEIAMAGCLVSTAVALAKTTAIKTLNIITVPVGKQQLITALFKTDQTKSSLIALGIVCGLMDLLSDEIQAMPPPKGGKAGPRRGSTADTDDEDPDRTVSEGEMPGEASTPLGAQPAKPQSKETPASTAGSVDPTMAAEIQRPSIANSTPWSSNIGLLDLWRKR